MAQQKQLAHVQSISILSILIEAQKREYWTCSCEVNKLLYLMVRIIKCQVMSLFRARIILYCTTRNDTCRKCIGYTLSCFKIFGKGHFQLRLHSIPHIRNKPADYFNKGRQRVLALQNTCHFCVHRVVVSYCIMHRQYHAQKTTTMGTV